MTRGEIFHVGKSRAERLAKAIRNAPRTADSFRGGDKIVLRETPRTLGDAIKHLPILSEDFSPDMPDPAPAPLPAWDAMK